MKTTSVLGLCALVCATAATKHNWQTGTLVEAAEVRETAGSVTDGGAVFGPAPPIPRSEAVVYRTLQGYVVRGADLVYMVQMRLPTAGHIRKTEVRPNVTIHGPVKYAFEKGKFYLLDEDGREFEMAVMRKRALTEDEKGQPSKDPK